MSPGAHAAPLGPAAARNAITGAAVSRRAAVPPGAVAMVRPRRGRHGRGGHGGAAGFAGPRALPAVRAAAAGGGRGEKGERGRRRRALPVPARPAPALPTAGPRGGGGGRVRPLGVGPRSVPAGDVPPAGDVVPAAPQPGLAELPLPSTHVGVSGNHFVLVCRFPSSLPLSSLTGKRRLVRAFCHRVCFFTVLEIYFSFRLPLEFVSPF